MRGFLAGFPAQYSPGLLCARPLPVFVHELERNVTFHVEHTNRKKKETEELTISVFLSQRSYMPYAQ